MDNLGRVDVYLDTTSRVVKGEYTHKVSWEAGKSSDTSLVIREGKPSVTVVNEDCIEVARRLTSSGKTCMLNMASYKKPGGGVKSGAMSQEEELARKSNLMFGLPEELYPLEMDDFIYTYGVTFFKGPYYAITEPFRCDIITVAAVNLNGLPIPDDYEKLMDSKVRTMLQFPQQHGCRNLVLSAFGCGVFKNHPLTVAHYFRRAILQGYGNGYDSIVFSVLNDRNSHGSNFETFKEVLDGI